MISGALAVETGLLFAALPTVTHALGWNRLLDSCHAVLAPIDSDPSVIGWLALALAALLGLRAVIGGLRSYRRALAARPELWLGTHTDRGDFELVIVPTDSPIAFGAPGRPPQVVISDWFVHRLEPSALEALIEHEAAHHRLHHSRYLTVVAAIEHAFPSLRGIRRSGTVIRDALEEWADAHAAREDTFAPALCEALADAGSVTDARTGQRVERLARPLLVATRTARAWCYTPISALALGGAVLAVTWLADPHVAGALGSHCA
jgi:hypothetical protein